MSMIKQLRLKLRLKQNEMAKKLGIGLETYRNYERGYTAMNMEVTIRFLKLRALPQDLELAKVLEELCPKKK